MELLGSLYVGERSEGFILTWLFTEKGKVVCLFGTFSVLVILYK